MRKKSKKRKTTGDRAVDQVIWTDRKSSDQVIWTDRSTTKGKKGPKLKGF